jgi:SAM-dependent methyltransferase
MSIHLDESLRMKRMARLARDCRSVLDIGWAQSPNPFLGNENVVGFDLNQRALPGNYHESVAGDAGEMTRIFAGRTFDAIVAGEILEHVEQPHAFLRDCRSLLGTNGRIILSTPNPNSPIERLLTFTLSRKYFYTTEHLCLYPQRWLIRMMENSGFCAVELHSGGFPMPPLGLIPFPRPWCHQTIAMAIKDTQR